jgi:hypothetical protein
MKYIGGARVPLISVSGLGLVALLTIGVAAYSLDSINRIWMSSVLISHRMERRLHVLESQLRFSVERVEIRRAFMEEVERVRPQIGSSKAGDYADSAILATDKFPRVDPLLLLSVGFVESRYDERAVSHAGARGLYQVLPSTGRRLIQDMGRNFDEHMLFDPHTNTEMAALYLNKLLEQHDDLHLALAAYNGGPRVAALFEAGSRRLAPETQAYVPNVLEHYERLVADMLFHHARREITLPKLKVPMSQALSADSSSSRRLRTELMSISPFDPFSAYFFSRSPLLGVREAQRDSNLMTNSLFTVN